jgi:hypothetical protein
MEPEGPLPHSPLPATCLYPEPTQSSPYPHIPPPEDPSLFRCLGRTKVSVQVRGFVCEYFVTKIRFHSQELLAPRPTPKLEDHSLSAVRYWLFNIFAATLHNGGRSSIRNLRTRHAVVTGTHRRHDTAFKTCFHVLYLNQLQFTYLNNWEATEHSTVPLS